MATIIKAVIVLILALATALLLTTLLTYPIVWAINYVFTPGVLIALFGVSYMTFWKTFVFDLPIGRFVQIIWEFKMKKQYVGISRDHSGSMGSLRKAAIKDYNDGISAIKVAASDNDIDTVVSVTSCGIRSAVQHEVVNSSVNRLQPITSYIADGSTPLFDSVGELIEIFKYSPDYSDPNVTFLVMAITDGEENASRVWKHKLGEEIRRLQGTDRWTFVFRVPRGYRRNLESLGIPSGNIQEWETSERGLQESSVHTVSAVSNYFQGVSRGVRSTNTFYANIGKVSSNQVVAAMSDISDEVAIYPVLKRSIILPFFEFKTGKDYRKGTAFYQLSKPEKAVQDYKVVVARNKNTGAVYGGTTQIRQLLGLPENGTISLKPGDHGDWDLFIQSTSTNRILMPGTSALYWEKA